MCGAVGKVFTFDPVTTGVAKAVGNEQAAPFIAPSKGLEAYNKMNETKTTPAPATTNPFGNQNLVISRNPSVDPGLNTGS